jgi:hypothetical protein
VIHQAVPSRTTPISPQPSETSLLASTSTSVATSSVRSIDTHAGCFNKPSTHALIHHNRTQAAHCPWHQHQRLSRPHQSGPTTPMRGDSTSRPVTRSSTSTTVRRTSSPLASKSTTASTSSPTTPCVVVLLATKVRNYRVISRV